MNDLRVRLRFALAGCLAAALALCSISCSPTPADNDTLYADVATVAPFSLTERSGRTVTSADLLGKVWVVSCFFTNCAGDCPKTTGSMARLQERLAGYGDVVLVSMSVFPQQDTPARLRQYAERWQADPQRWWFLTGPETVIHGLIENSFKQTVTRSDNPKSGYEIDHTFSLMVVDHRGRIRGYVDGLKPEEVDRLEQRVKELVQAKYLPAVNASLNAICACLLTIGYVAIKRRRIALHKTCMLSAVAVSVVFLACYLYYHFAILHGQATRFPEDSGMRSVYLAILGSHTVLAAVVAPLALFTMYLGLRGRLQRHVRVARWTLPLWLYVSVTGVVVYVMLYHLYPPA